MALRADELWMVKVRLNQENGKHFWKADFPSFQMIPSLNESVNFDAYDSNLEI